MPQDATPDVVGHLEFDLPFTSYSDRDMGGETAVTTRAAAMGPARGVIVVASAGNGVISRRTRAGLRVDA